MKAALFFIAGMMAGGFLGVAFMCMLQVNRDEHLKEDEYSEQTGH